MRGGPGFAHESTRLRSVEWYTPAVIFEKLGVEFDLDPAAPPGGVPWIPARSHYSLRDNGLAQRWQGKVWLNPPYGLNIVKWTSKMAEHDNGIMLTFSRTDTRWFQAAAKKALLVCFVARRIEFIPGDKSLEGKTRYQPGSASVLMAFGKECASALEEAHLGICLSWTRARALDSGSLF